jgi:hypothetical protein
MKTETQILEALELIHKDANIIIGENEYLPIGEIAHATAKHIKYLRKHINELEAWRYDG